MLPDLDTCYAAPDIDRAFGGLRLCQCLDQQLDQIAHVKEITRLFAVAENRDRQAFFDALGKDADHARIRRRRILARSEHVRVAHRHVVQPMDAIDAFKVQLDVVALA